MFPVLEYQRKTKEVQQALLLRATLLTTNNILFTYLRKRNNSFPKAKIFLSYYHYYF